MFHPILQTPFVDRPAYPCCPSQHAILDHAQAWAGEQWWEQMCRDCGMRWRFVLVNFELLFIPIVEWTEPAMVDRSEPVRRFLKRVA